MKRAIIIVLINVSHMDRLEHFKKLLLKSAYVQFLNRFLQNK